jgi:hypothetical protein
LSPLAFEPADRVVGNDTFLSQPKTAGLRGDNGRRRRSTLRSLAH